jgi:hypothetical protein
MFLHRLRSVATLTWRILKNNACVVYVCYGVVYFFLFPLETFRIQSCKERVWILVHSGCRSHLGSLDTDGGLILNGNTTYILKTLCGLNWLKIGSVCELMSL